MDDFLEKFQGGGVISDPKNYIGDFVGFKAVYFGSKFSKNVQKNSKKTSIIGETDVPNIEARILVLKTLTMW